MSNLTESNNKELLLDFLAKTREDGGLFNEDLISLFVPLFKQLAKIHDQNKVANLTELNNLTVVDREIKLDVSQASKPTLNVKKLKKLNVDSSVFEITERITTTTEVGTGDVEYESDEIKKEQKSEINIPVFVPNYGTYEQEIGHYDQKTELFICGLLMASFAFNLDLNDTDDFKQFVNHKGRLYSLNSDIHPTILLVISELTELDRSKRSRETSNLIWKLENFKDYNFETETDIIKTEGFINHDLNTRDTYVLHKLKSRLFELSRRNRLLYFKPSSKFLNLTIASVPTVLYYENIKEKDLFLWNNDISSKIKTQAKLNLSRYLQFDSAGYISSNLDKIRIEARKDLYEYGFSQLKLVVAFLNWYNFKDNKDEKIHSPLLILPVTLTKKKGVKDDYLLEFSSSEAEVNPVLVHYLKELYDLDLPQYIDLEKVDLNAFYGKIKTVVENGNHQIKLSLIDKPKIKLIQSIAKQKATQHQKKIRYTTPEFNTSNFSYSYKRDQFNPLGYQIFDEHVRPKASFLEYLINDDITLSSNTFSKVKTRELYSTDTEGEINPYNWEFDICNITLGNFNSKKMSLVSDYKSIMESGIKNPVFSHLFSDEPKQLSNKKEAIPSFEDNFYVLNADATQSKAIAKAKTGRSYIIQGPPGTGKSQTITNLIADFASRGKRILFVCEKRAALDVVYARLKQRNIHHLSSLIHDSQLDKKRFIMDAKSTYDKFIAEDDNFEKLEKKRNGLLNKIKKEKEVISNFHTTLKTTYEDIGISFIELIENLLSLNHQYPENNFSYRNKVETPKYTLWKSSENLLKELSQALVSLGFSANPREYSLLSIHESYYKGENVESTLSNSLASIKTTMEDWLELADIYEFDEFIKSDINQIGQLCEYSSIIFSLIKNQKQEVLTIGSPQAESFDSLCQSFKDVKDSLSEIKEKNKNWKQKLSQTDAASAHEKVKKLEGKFYSFLIPAFGKIKKVIKANYDFTAHSIPPTLTSVITNLLSEYKEDQSLQNLEKQLENNYGLEDINTVQSKINELQSSNATEKQILLKYNSDVLKALSEINPEIQRFKENVISLGANPEKDNLKSLVVSIQEMEKNLNTLPVLLPYLKAFVELPQEVQKFTKNSDSSLSLSEKEVTQQAIKKLYDKDITLTNTSGYALSYAVSTMQKLHQKLLELNSDYLIEKYKSKFKKLLHNSTLLAKQQTQENKVEKSTFLKSRKILENEFNKSMRYKSIRELKTLQSAYILDILKPIWLMSPLSVSDTLPVDSDLFDVVIFDEASQITLEEGIPTIFRSKQVIIVGDEMQMPPTNFFSSTTLEKSEIDEQDNKDAVVIDADSMLTHATKKLEDVMLAWHYRSRYEGLIGFSNNAFYKGDLLTIPDQNILTLLVQGDDIDITPIDRIENEVISYHHLKDGVYAKRKNQDEANYIAEMLKDILIKKPELSVGIVAFSMEQQNTIETAIHDLTKKDPSFSETLENAYNRIEDSQQVGLFVKNLENVQGDERDIIIISVCYGYNEKGKMLMNFGPINRKGGEKRLNVIFSRAKKHMAIVSSIVHEDIKNEYNEGANFLRRFLQYAYALSSNKQSLAEEVLHSLSANTKEEVQKKDDVVTYEIISYLKENGYECETDIGLSKFKISIGVKEKNHFVLGIILDSKDYYKTDDIIDQYVLRPGLLNAFDWKNITVFKKDWLDRPEIVKKRLLSYLKGEEIKEPIAKPKSRTIENEPLKESIKTEIVQEPKSEIIEKEENDNTVNYLEFSEENSHKFWEVQQQKTNLIIRYGRIGTNGRTLTKTFDTPELAQKEQEKLIGVKKSKGYFLR